EADTMMIHGSIPLAISYQRRANSTREKSFKLLLRTNPLRGVGFVDEAAFIEPANDAIVDDVVNFDFADFRTSERHQTLHVAQAIGRRIGFAVHGAMEIGIAFFRSGSVDSEP